MQGWILLAGGLWTLISPWILGFADINLARWSNVTVGTLVFIVALWLIFGRNDRKGEQS